ncbi:MAG: hypothetical protein PHE27_08175 [Alphaproteobacteria bacterium]|nr:hypothetical protein [Alphaproteobacteria bacterium]
MPQAWLMILAGFGALSFVAGVYFAVFWLRRMRDSLLSSLADMTGHQIRTAQRMGGAIDQLKKQQDGLSRQIQALMQEESRLRSEISSVSSRLEVEKHGKPGRPTLH